MTPRQIDELRSIPMWQAACVTQTLRSAGRVHAAVLVDAYEERLAIITEGRSAEPEEISRAWESVLGIKFSTADEKRPDP